MDHLVCIISLSHPYHRHHSYYCTVHIDIGMTHRGDFTNHNGELERMKEEELNCKNVLNIMIVNVTLIQPMIHSNNNITNQQQLNRNGG